MPVSLNTFTIIGITPVENPQDARARAVKFKSSTTIARGTIVAKLDADGKFEAYTGSGTAGLQTAAGICMYDIKTDSSGNIFFGNDTTASTINIPFQTAPIWESGTFLIAELSGWSGNESDITSDFQARSDTIKLYIP